MTSASGCRNFDEATTVEAVASITRRSAAQVVPGGRTIVSTHESGNMAALAALRGGVVRRDPDTLRRSGASGL